jgi:hypothetical protein
MKKGTRFASSPLNLVRLAGIEPTTPWFVAKYSIQLSYSREEQDYSRVSGKYEALKHGQGQESVIYKPHSLHRKPNTKKPETKNNSKNEKRD